MKWIYNEAFIKGKENIFYGFIILIVIMIIYTIVVVNKELKKKDENK